MDSVRLYWSKKELTNRNLREIGEDEIDNLMIRVCCVDRGYVDHRQDIDQWWCLDIKYTVFKVCEVCSSGVIDELFPFQEEDDVLYGF